jgi:hypothetical protein
VINRDRAIEIAREECRRRGWEDRPPYSATSGREYVLWGQNRWFVVTNADQQGDNAYIHVDAESGEVVGAAFASKEERKARRGIWRW